MSNDKYLRSQKKVEIFCITTCLILICSIVAFALIAAFNHSDAKELYLSTIIGMGGGGFFSSILSFILGEKLIEKRINIFFAATYVIFWTLGIIFGIVSTIELSLDGVREWSTTITLLAICLIPLSNVIFGYFLARKNSAIFEQEFNEGLHASR